MTRLEDAVGAKPLVVITFSERLRPAYLADRDLERLRAFAEPQYIPIPADQQRERWRRGEPPPPPPAPRPELLAALPGADALVVCNGAPMVDAALLEHA